MTLQDMTREELIAHVLELQRQLTELKDTKDKLRDTEQQIRENGERLCLLYENPRLGYQSLDENGRFLEVNQAWLDTLGYERDEVIGRWFGDFLAPGCQERFQADYPKFKASGEIHWIERDMLRKDGSRITVVIDGQVGHDERGRLRQIHCILHDISEIKRYQDALEETEQRYRAVIMDPENWTRV
jgi:PAS domain S-box-containing protein